MGGSSRRSNLGGPIVSLAIVGAGLMGRQIAAACLGRGIPVTLADISAAALDRAAAELNDLPHARLTLADPNQGFGHCDVVIETIVEDETAKCAVLSEIEASADDGALLASNTSSLSISRLAAGLRRPERFCGLHFCHPLRERRLAEVVPGENTSAATVSAAAEVVVHLGRIPLVVADRPGFLLNRLLFPYLNAALELLGEGAGLAAIEAAARERGMAVGPFTFLDEIGLDTAVRVGATLYRAFPDRVHPSGLLVALAKGGHLGRKSGSGFFLWSEDASPDGENPAVSRLTGADEAGDLRREAIGARLLLPLLHEVKAAIADGAASNAAVAWRALRHGVGFRGTLTGLDAGRAA